MNQIPNGFRPCISPDGLRIAGGFNEVLDIDAKTGHAMHIDTQGEAAWAGWHNGRIAYGRYLTTGRELVNGPIQPPPQQLPGVNPARAVVDGWTVSSANGQHFINGHAVGYGSQASSIEDFDGTHYIYKPNNAGSPLVVRRVDTQAEVARIVDPITNSVIYTAPDGTPYVMANHQGSASLYAFGDRLYIFPAGNNAGCISRGPYGLYAWTVGQRPDGSPYVQARSFSALAGEPVVTIEGMWWAGFQAVWRDADQRWTAAGYYNGPGGTLYVDADVKVAGSVPVPPNGDYIVNVPAGTKRLIVNLP